MLAMDSRKQKQQRTWWQLIEVKENSCRQKKNEIKGITKSRTWDRVNRTKPHCVSTIAKETVDQQI
jgi:hypothetical protein